MTRYTPKKRSARKKALAARPTISPSLKGWIVKWCREVEKLLKKKYETYFLIVVDFDKKDFQDKVISYYSNYLSIFVRNKLMTQLFGIVIYMVGKTLG